MALDFSRNLERIRYRFFTIKQLPCSPKLQLAAAVCVFQRDPLERDALFLGTYPPGILRNKQECLKVARKCVHFYLFGGETSDLPSEGGMSETPDCAEKAPKRCSKHGEESARNFDIEGLESCQRF